MNRKFYHRVMTALVLSLTACGSSGQTAADVAANNQEEVPEETAETVNNITEETSKEEETTSKKDDGYIEFNLNETVTNDFME